jgi:hypothetical protein
MSKFYMLTKDRKVIMTEDVLEWAAWFETFNRFIDESRIGDVRVSTVFIGLDYSFGEDSAPLIFETMIFGGKNNHYQERYTNYDDARAGHAIAVDMVLDEIIEKQKQNQDEGHDSSSPYQECGRSEGENP